MKTGWRPLTSVQKSVVPESKENKKTQSRWKVAYWLKKKKKKKALLNVRANVPPTQWPTVTPERHTPTPQPLGGIMNMDVLWSRRTHMFRPPLPSPPPPLPPGDWRRNCRFSSGTQELAEISIYLHWLSVAEGQLAERFVSPPPTYSMDPRAV